MPQFDGICSLKYGFEMTKKVHSIVSVVNDNTVWLLSVAPCPARPFRLWCLMLSNVRKCASDCVGSTESIPQKSCESSEPILSIEPEKCESSQSVNSGICVPSTTKAARDSLVKWFSDTPEISENAAPLRISQDADFAASEMVRSIMTDLNEKSS